MNMGWAKYSLFESDPLGLYSEHDAARILPQWDQAQCVRCLQGLQADPLSGWEGRSILPDST